MLAAMAAKRAGDEARSVELFTDLLARHPTSPLAQNAMIERFRALKRSGNKEAAAQAALRYLHDYPAGMASDEARGVAAQPKAEAPTNAYPP
jgi:outer membrane protein assembly factor BamD (BamD/ComL family)